jgi:hypothetical protein
MENEEGSMKCPEGYLSLKSRHEKMPRSKCETVRSNEKNVLVPHVNCENFKNDV